MAISIRKPTTPNIANSKIVFRTDSTQVTQAQFQYVCDIKDNSDNLIQRVKQQPNPNGFGIFDLSRITTTQFDTPDKIWKIQEVYQNTSSAQQFNYFFGEEYAPSVSASVTLYTGIGTNTGDPAVSGSDYYFVLGGALDDNELINNFTWNSSSKLDYVNPAAVKSSQSFDNALTDYTLNEVTSTDYHTISFLNGNMTGDTPISTSAQDVYIMRLQEYDVTGSIVNTSLYYNAEYVSGNGGPRTSPSDLWADVYTSQSVNTRLVHFPTGPQNFFDAGNQLDPSTTYYICDFFDQSPGGSLGNTRWGSVRFDIVDNCDYEGTRFSWKNKYGVWDYFNFTLAKDANTSIERKQFHQTFLNFSGTSIEIDKTRRGQSQYYNELNVDNIAQSDWLTQTEADNLRELFYSTDVYVQDGTDFYPVIITDSVIEQKKNIRTQKLFRYTINYRLANDLRPRR